MYFDVTNRNTNPAWITLTNNYTLPASTRFLVMIEGASTYTVSVPDGQSHQIVNAGTVAQQVFTSTQSLVTLQPGDAVMCIWDAGGSQHKVWVVYEPFDLDAAMSDTSAAAVQNQVVKSYVDAQVAAAASGDVAVVDTLAALRALGAQPAVVYVKGHTAVEDGGEGFFQYLGSGANSADIDDNTAAMGCDCRLHRDGGAGCSRPASQAAADGRLLGAAL